MVGCAENGLRIRIEWKKQMVPGTGQEGVVDDPDDHVYNAIVDGSCNLLVVLRLREGGTWNTGRGTQL